MRAGQGFLHLSLILGKVGSDCGSHEEKLLRPLAILETMGIVRSRSEATPLVNHSTIQLPTHVPHCRKCDLHDVVGDMRMSEFRQTARK